jgi:hypothetical protein
MYVVLYRSTNNTYTVTLTEYGTLLLFIVPYYGMILVLRTIFILEYTGSTVEILTHWFIGQTGTYVTSHYGIVVHVQYYR